jgi:phosphoserine phosphatase
MNNRGGIVYRDGYSPERFLEGLKTEDYAIFDLDGTIYPGLFLFDLAKYTFGRDHEKADKLMRLGFIAKKYKEGKFTEAYKGFVALLKDEDPSTLINYSGRLIGGSYKYAKLTINRLGRDYSIRSLLISITADFIGDVARKRFGFDDVMAVKYRTTMSDGRLKFTGKTWERIDSPQAMKKRMLNRLFGSEGGNFRYVHFFDSIDDSIVASEAAIRVAVNPNIETYKATGPDIILRGKGDPWKGIYELVK